MKKAILNVSVLLGVAGCVEYAEITTPPQSVTFTNSAVQKNIHNYSPTPIRTMQRSDPKKAPDSEVVGIPCKIAGTGYTAKVSTPAVVNLPTYLGKTDPISVVCGTGAAKVAQKVMANNATVAAINNSSGGQGGILGALVEMAAKAALTAARNPAEDKFNYMPVFVDMTPKK